MRILIIGPAHPYRGGISDTNESLCRALDHEGHNVSIVTFTAQYPGVLFPGKTQLREEAAPADLTISRLIHAYHPWKWRTTAKRIRRIEADLIIFRFWTPFIGLVYGSLAKRLKQDHKLIAMVDNANPHESSFMDRWLTEAFLSQVHGGICLSKYVKDQLRKVTRIPLTHSLHPINSGLGQKLSRQEARNKLGLTVEGKYLLFFGLIRKYKGLQLLIDSFELAAKKIPDLKLIIAGEFYEDKSPYIEAMEKAGLRDRVIVHDRFIPQEEVPLYFSSADLLTLTYLQASQSGVTQMAMHFDLPMLVTDVGALSEYVTHDVIGYVVPPEKERIAEAIEDFILKDRYEEMSRMVSEKKATFDWKHFSQDLLRFVDGVQEK